MTNKSEFEENYKSYKENQKEKSGRNSTQQQTEGLTQTLSTENTHTRLIASGRGAKTRRGEGKATTFGKIYKNDKSDPMTNCRISK